MGATSKITSHYMIIQLTIGRFGDTRPAEERLQRRVVSTRPNKTRSDFVSSVFRFRSNLWSSCCRCPKQKRTEYLIQAGKIDGERVFRWLSPRCQGFDSQHLCVRTSVDQYWSKVCGEIYKSIFTSIISMAL